MRLIINLLLLAIVGALAYMLYFSIKEPIAFSDAKTVRLGAVTDKLKEIRVAQECYRGIKGGFAPTFDELVTTLKNDSFLIVKIIGDPDDPNGAFKRVENYRMAADSMRSLGLYDKLDDLATVPFSSGDKFELQADTMTYQKTLVQVVECRTKFATFMGEEYSDPKYAKYDNTYSPSNYVKFGDMNTPNLGGNWE